MTNQNKNFSLFSNTIWSKALSSTEMQKVCDETKEATISAGAYVCRKGDPVDHWIGVVEGLLKMSSMSPEGKSVTFTGMLSGGWFGEGSLLKNETRRYDVVALRVVWPRFFTHI